MEIKEKEKKRVLNLINNNKDLLEKVKELNEKKNKIEKEESVKKDEIEKKCDYFKKDICQKFTSNFPELESLQAENNILRQKFDKLKTKFHSEMIGIINGIEYLLYIFIILMYKTLKKLEEYLKFSFIPLK